MLQPRWEERLHIAAGAVNKMVRYNGADVQCLIVRDGQALLYTADVGAGRQAGLTVDHKGDFLGWVPAANVEALSR